MATTKKDRGIWVVGQLIVLDTLTIAGACTLTGSVELAGDFTVGESGTGSDFTVYGDTAGYSLRWDANADTNGGMILVGTSSLTGNLTVDGTTVSLDGSTSVKAISAALVGIESADIRLGVSSSIYMDIAVTAVTGAVAITHTGTGPAVTWTADSLAFTGNLSSDGTTALFDGSTSFRGVSAGFTSLESPANRFGVNSTIYMQVATTDTTGITAITHTGSAPAVTWTADSLSFVGDFDADGATVSVDGSTSVRGISAGFVSLESGDIRFGANATEYMKVAVTATTGAVAITHTGSAPAVTWTADSLSLTGDFSADGATVLVDGSTSMRGVSAGFVSLEAGDIRFGYSDSIYTKFAVANTTGNLTITHVGGSTDLVTWTAAGGFSLVGNVAVTGTFGASGTISVGLDATAGTLELYPATTNSGTTTFTMTDNAGDTVTNVNFAAQAGARTYTVPDTGDTTSSFLMTDSTKTWWSIALGVVGEDTDGAGTNGAGIAGGAPDITTNMFDNSGGTVYVKVYDFGTTTWDDLSTSALLTAGSDWAVNYQLQPDADAEEAGDAFAIGLDTKFCEVAFDDLATDAGTLATYGGDCGKWQYSTGAGTWSDLTVYDGTDLTAHDGKRPLQQTGAISFAPQSDWVAATYDGQEAYWIQWVVTAAQLTQSAIIDTTNKDEPFVVIPNSDTFDAPFKCSITRVRVTDMGATLHDQIIKFVIGNFTDGVFSAELSWAASQANDAFTLASPLAADADDLIGVCITDDGGSTNNPAFMLEIEASYED